MSAQEHNKKRVVAAASLHCDRDGHDAVYHLQVIANPRATDGSVSYVVQRQYGARNSKLQTKVDPAQANLENALDAIRHTIVLKTMPVKDRVYQRLKTAVLPDDCAWVPEYEDAQLIDLVPTKAPQTPVRRNDGSLPVDLADPELRECLTSEKWIGVAIAGDWRKGRLVVSHGKVELDGAEIGSSHPLYYDARSLGSAIVLLGNVSETTMAVFDCEREQPFVERVQHLADTLYVNETKNIVPASYLVSSEDKKRAIDGLVSAKHSAVRFLGLNDAGDIATVRIFT
jgi:hypothetical protein